MSRNRKIEYAVALAWTGAAVMIALAASHTVGAAIAGVMFGLVLGVCVAESMIWRTLFKD